MAIREQQDIPRHLPPAILYIDDVEDIVKLFQEVLSAKKPEREPTISFSVKRFECDSVEEFTQFGSKTNDFGVEVEAGKYAIFLRVSRGSPANWWGYGLTMQERFHIYGHLHALFFVRRVRWKAALLSIPPWLAVLIFLPFLAFAVRDIVSSGHISSWRLGSSFAFALVVSSWLTYNLLVQQTIVRFKRVHEHNLSKVWAVWKPYVIAAILGGFAKALFDMVRQAILK